MGRCNIQSAHISIIIPTYKRAQLLRNCLELLVPQLSPGCPIEVLVCDDASDDETRQMLESDFPTIRWLRGPSRGPAANRNMGAMQAAGNWLVFLDDDCLPGVSFVSSYCEAMDNLDEECFVALEGPTFQSEVPPSLMWIAPSNPHGGNNISCNFAISRWAFEKVGRFDERYPTAAFEDTEFFARLRAMNGKINFVANAYVRHPLRRVKNPLALAKNWEGKVIYSLDQGISPTTIYWRLPWHVLRVIQSRFRKQQMSIENAHAACLFFAEWLYVLRLTPRWVGKWSKKPRSAFWKKHVSEHGSVPKYSF